MDKRGRRRLEAQGDFAADRQPCLYKTLSSKCMTSRLLANCFVMDKTLKGCVTTTLLFIDCLDRQLSWTVTSGNVHGPWHVCWMNQ